MAMSRVRGNDQESVVKLRPEVWRAPQYGGGICERGWMTNIFCKYILRTFLTGQAAMVNKRKTEAGAALRL